MSIVHVQRIEETELVTWSRSKTMYGDQHRMNTEGGVRDWCWVT